MTDPDHNITRIATQPDGGHLMAKRWWWGLPVVALWVVLVVSIAPVYGASPPAAPADAPPESASPLAGQAPGGAVNVLNQQITNVTVQSGAPAPAASAGFMEKYGKWLGTILLPLGFFLVKRRDALGKAKADRDHRGEGGGSGTQPDGKLAEQAMGVAEKAIGAVDRAGERAEGAHDRAHGRADELIDHLKNGREHDDGR